MVVNFERRRRAEYLEHLVDHVVAAGISVFARKLHGGQVGLSEVGITEIKVGGESIDSPGSLASKGRFALNSKIQSRFDGRNRVEPKRTLIDRSPDFSSSNKST